MRVLIVDDEPLILKGLVKIITKVAPEGTTIREAHNAIEALDIMKNYLPDITITDINMPIKNGFQLIYEARQLQLCNRFIILTGYDEFEYVRKALREDVIDYLLKPVDQYEIEQLLSNLKTELPTSHNKDYTKQANQILSYLQVHFRKDVSLDHLSQITNLHPNYICTLFKKETGHTFLSYLNNIRIGEAKKLLIEQKDLPVCEVGRIVGYENKHYFTKLFKRYTGTTPGSYRKIN